MWWRLGGGSWENYLLHWLTHLLGHSYIKLDFIIYFGQSSAATTPSDDVWIRKTHLGEKKMKKMTPLKKSKIHFFSIWSRYVKGVSKFRSQWHSTNIYVHCSYLLIVWIPCWYFFPLSQSTFIQLRLLHNWVCYTTPSVKVNKYENHDFANCFRPIARKS